MKFVTRCFSLCDITWEALWDPNLRTGMAISSKSDVERKLILLRTLFFCYNTLFCVYLWCDIWSLFLLGNNFFGVGIIPRLSNNTWSQPRSDVLFTLKTNNMSFHLHIKCESESLALAKINSLTCKHKRVKYLQLTGLHAQPSVFVYFLQTFSLLSEMRTQPCKLNAHSHTCLIIVKPTTNLFLL